MMVCPCEEITAEQVRELVRNGATRMEHIVSACSAGASRAASADSVAACHEAAKGGGYGALVALGGGSNIDTAKAVAVLLKYGGSAEDYFGEHQVPGPVLPLVAVSTTAGTGSEVSAASVLADPANRRRGALHEVGGSDAHYLPTVGQTFTLFPGHTAADFRRALETGKVQAGGQVYSFFTLARVAALSILGRMPVAQPSLAHAPAY